MSQADFAKALYDHWSKVRKRDPSFPASSTEKALRTAISKVEREKMRFDAPTRQIAAEVLKIPRIWMDNPAPSWTVFLRDLTLYLEKQRLEDVPKEEGLPQAAPFNPTFSFQISALPVTTERQVFTQRLPQLKDITSAALQGPGARLIVIRGPTGTGKSTLVHKWLQINKDAIRGRPICAIQCAGKSGDNVVKELVSYFESAGLSATPDNLGKLICTYEPLLVLDNVEQFAHAPLPHHAISPTVIAQHFREAFGADRNFCVIATWSDDISPSTFAPSPIPELESLAGSERTHEFNVDNLRTEDAIKFLSKCGLEGSEETYRRIVNHLTSNPTLLEMFIGSYKAASTNRTKHLDSVSLTPNSILSIEPNAGRKSTFQRLLQTIKQQNHHDFLLLQVLAFAHAPLDTSAIERIILKLDPSPQVNHGSKGFLAGLSRFSPMLLTSASTQTRNAHGATRSNSRGHSTQRKSLNELAKRTLRDILVDDLGPELEIGVHIAFAEHFASIVPSDQSSTNYEPNYTDIDHFHGLIHHLVQIYKLVRKIEAPTKPNTTIQSRPTLTNPHASVSELTEREGPLSLTSAQHNPNRFLNAIFENLMLRKIGGEDFVVTRQLGDFEKKLKMLTLFLDDVALTSHGDVQPIAELSDRNKRTLLIDVAISANYCGNLELAHRALTRVAPSYSTVSLPTANDIVNAMQQASDTKGQPAQESLRELSSRIDDLSSYLNLIATVHSREGRLRFARDTLASRYQATRAVAEAIVPMVGALTLTAKQQRYRRIAIRGLRRICAKFGQVASYLGDITTAKEAFSLAQALDGSLLGTNAVLRGDTGRAYVRLLLATDPVNKKDATTAIVADNLEHAARMKRYYERVEWLVERARMHRITGNFGAAEASLKEISEIVDRDRTGLSFAVQKEIELESIRISMAQGHSVRRREVEALLQSCHRANHRLLVCDLLNISKAIAETPSERAHCQSQLQQALDETGYKPFELA
jgi:hypothetical protein